MIPLINQLILHLGIYRLQEMVLELKFEKKKEPPKEEEEKKEQSKNDENEKRED